MRDISGLEGMEVTGTVSAPFELCHVSQQFRGI